MSVWAPYIERYRRGEWRDRIFRDMVFDDARRLGDGLRVLDIGCGRGFDGDVPLQQSVAAMAREYIGIEPDPTVAVGPYFTETHRCFFEDAPLRPNSVHIAFAIMVLEHLARPQEFFAKLRQVLVDGGVFWGLTVDARHWFCRALLLGERLKVKDLYLTALMGQRGAERYENYPAYYRCNTPHDIRQVAGDFTSCDFINFSRVGQCNRYYPRALHGIANILDSRAIQRGRPGTLLAVRLEK